MMCIGCFVGILTVGNVNSDVLGSQFTLGNVCGYVRNPYLFLVGYPLILGARSHSHTDSSLLSAAFM